MFHKKGKVENLKGEGSRGVIVYPADQLQFGASVRKVLYHLLQYQIINKLVHDVH